MIKNFLILNSYLASDERIRCIYRTAFCFCTLEALEGDGAAPEDHVHVMRILGHTNT